MPIGGRAASDRRVTAGRRVGSFICFFWLGFGTANNNCAPVGLGHDIFVFPPPRLLGNFPFPDDLDKDIFVDETVQVRVATRLESCSARVMLNNLPRHRERQTKNIVEYYLLIFLSVALPAFFSRSFKLGILVSTKLVRGMIINQRRTWEFRVRYK